MPCVGKTAQLFLGTLRDSEVERVNDKVSQAVVETLLAMTIFREDFTVRCVCMVAAAGGQRMGAAGGGEGLA
jgi:hypothetical protein